MIIKSEQVDKVISTLSNKIRCILIHGSNEGMIALLAKQFTKAISTDIYDAFHVSYLDMSDISSDIGLLYAEFNSQSLMGGRRAIVVKDVTNALCKPLKELLSSSPSDNLIILTSSSLKTKDALVGLAKESPEFYGIGCYDDRDEDITSFASKFIAKNGFRIDNNSFQLLCSRLSNDRKISENELEKLITYMGSKVNITDHDIMMVISDTAASSQDDLNYCVGLGQSQKAISYYNRLIFEGEQPVTIVRSLSYHFMKILDCLVKMEKGESAERVILGLRPPLIFFRKSQFLSQLKTWNRKRVMSALNLLYQTERDCKTTNYPAEECVSFTLMRIANGVKKFR